MFQKFAKIVGLLALENVSRYFLLSVAFSAHRLLRISHSFSYNDKGRPLSSVCFMRGGSTYGTPSASCVGAAAHVRAQPHALPRPESRNSVHATAIEHLGGDVGDPRRGRQACPEPSSMLLVPLVVRQFAAMAYEKIDANRTF